MRAQALKTQPAPLASIEALPGVASQAIAGKDELDMSKVGCVAGLVGSTTAPDLAAIVYRNGANGFFSAL